MMAIRLPTGEFEGRLLSVSGRTIRIRSGSISSTSPITVAASNYFGSASYYSTPGASILVTAPGGEPQGASGLATTDRPGALGAVVFSKAAPPASSRRPWSTLPKTLMPGAPGETKPQRAAIVAQRIRRIDRRRERVGKNVGSFSGTRMDSGGRRRRRRGRKRWKRRTLRDWGGLERNSPDTHRAR